LLAVVPGRPDFAGRIVAVEVRPAQFRQLLAIVNEPARERPRFAVVMFEGRIDNWRRPAFAIGVEGMAALGDAPAVVGPLLEEIHLLPQILAVLSDPDVAGLLVHRHAPRIAEAVRPDFGTGILEIDEGIVRRHRVGLTGGRMIDVDTEDL